ncbi:hypothetical protein CSUI_002594 [Cystoisospora suis]|uniref:CCDC81 HU domain-containing protein n=1 Tax=Cystoisospora suis TaxID=483139 RepID=A0A2C6L8F4_9APIC|nr:hypothetical protein CSUI_002594 [Cystoisospora suis]
MVAEHASDAIVTAGPFEGKDQLVARTKSYAAFPDPCGTSMCALWCASVRGVVEHVLQLPLQYPGPHHESQPRAAEDLAPTDPTRQLLLIWDAMCDYVSEQLQQAKGVTIKDFGSFIFERGIAVTSPRVPELGHVGREKEVVFPRFLLAESLRQELTRQDTKEDIRRQHISGSVFQTKKMTALNPVPIAAGCYMRQDVVASGLAAIFRAITELVRTNYDLEIDMKFAVIRIVNKRLRCAFSKVIRAAAQSTTDAGPFRDSLPVSKRWRESHLSKSMVEYLGDPSPTSMTERRRKTDILANTDLVSISSVSYSSRP